MSERITLVLNMTNEDANLIHDLLPAHDTADQPNAANSEVLRTLSEAFAHAIRLDADHSITAWHSPNLKAASPPNIDAFPEHMREAVRRDAETFMRNMGLSPKTDGPTNA